MSKPHQFTFEMHSDLDLVASEVPTQRVVELVVVPPSAGPAAARPALNLALVIDRSGSMSGDKLANVRRAAEHVLDLLQEQDQVAIVAYDDTITLLAPSQHVTAQARASLKSHLQELTPGNMTNLCGGWLSGCEEVARVANRGGWADQPGPAADGWPGQRGHHRPGRDRPARQPVVEQGHRHLDFRGGAGLQRTPARTHGQPGRRSFLFYCRPAPPSRPFLCRNSANWRQ